MTFNTLTSKLDEMILDEIKKSDAPISRIKIARSTKICVEAINAFGWGNVEGVGGALQRLKFIGLIEYSKNPAGWVAK